MYKFDTSRINDALAVLNEAARDNKTELRAAMEHEYADLTSMVSEGTDRINNGVSARLEAGKKKVLGMASDVDLHVHTNPWPYIGGVAAVALISGYLLGRSRRE